MPLDDPSLLDHDEAVHARDGRQAVRDRDDRLALHEAEKLLLDGELDFAVERRSRLVEHEDRRILQDHARKRDPLSLPAGELDPALADVRLVAGTVLPVLQAQNESWACALRAAATTSSSLACGRP